MLQERSGSSLSFQGFQSLDGMAFISMLSLLGEAVLPCHLALSLQTPLLTAVSSQRAVMPVGFSPRITPRRVNSATDTTVSQIRSKHTRSSRSALPLKYHLSHITAGGVRVCSTKGKQPQWLHEAELWHKHGGDWSCARNMMHTNWVQMQLRTQIALWCLLKEQFSSEKQVIEWIWDPCGFGDLGDAVANIQKLTVVSSLV